MKCLLYTRPCTKLWDATVHKTQMVLAFVEPMCFLGRQLVKKVKGSLSKYREIIQPGNGHGWNKAALERAAPEDISEEAQSRLWPAGSEDPALRSWGSRVPGEARHLRALPGRAPPMCPASGAALLSSVLKLCFGIWFDEKKGLQRVWKHHTTPLTGSVCVGSEGLGEEESNMVGQESFWITKENETQSLGLVGCRRPLRLLLMSPSSVFSWVLPETDWEKDVSVDSLFGRRSQESWVGGGEVCVMEQLQVWAMGLHPGDLWECPIDSAVLWRGKGAGHQSPTPVSHGLRAAPRGTNSSAFVVLQLARESHQVHIWRGFRVRCEESLGPAQSAASVASLLPGTGTDTG